MSSLVGDISASIAGIGPAPNEFDPRNVLGTTGLKHFDGVMDEERLVRLRGRNGALYYQEMIDNSPVLASALDAINLLIRQVEFRIEPADESQEAKRMVEFVEGAFEDMEHTFEDFLDEALSFLQFGFCTFEKVFKVRRGPDSDDKRLRSKFTDGRIGWRKFSVRSQDSLDRWVFDDDNDLAGMIQVDIYNSRGPVYIPLPKMLHFRTKSLKDNPEGRSLLRSVVLAYHMSKRIQEFEAIGTERDLAGMPIFEVPPEVMMPDASPAALSVRRTLEDFVTQVRRDERWGGLVPSEFKSDGQPSQYKFKLLTSGGARQIDTDAIVRRHESRMLMAFLAQFLLLGTEGTGSYSLSSNMTSLFATAIGTYMDRFCDVLNRQAIPQLLEMNNLDQQLAPKMVHGDIEGPDLDELGKYLVALAQTGQPLDHDALRRKLLEVADLPLDEDEFSADNAEDDGGQLPTPTPGSSSPSAPVAITPDQTRSIIEINSAVSEGRMTSDAAVVTIAAMLGVDENRARRFIINVP